MHFYLLEAPYNQCPPSIWFCCWCNFWKSNEPRWKFGFTLGGLCVPLSSIRFHRSLAGGITAGPQLSSLQKGVPSSTEDRIMPFILAFKKSSFSTPKLFITCTERTIQDIVFWKRGREGLQVPVQMSCTSCTLLLSFWDDLEIIGREGIHRWSGKK